MRQGVLVASLGHLVAAGCALVLFTSGSLRSFDALWGRSAFTDLALQPGGWVGVLVTVVVASLAHESLHAVGWRLAAPGVSVVFRPTWRVLGIEARLSGPIPAGAYRVGLSLPALVLCLVPVVAGLVGGNGLLVLWAQFFFLESFTDVVTACVLRGVPPEAMVRALPGRLGAEVLPASPNGTPPV